VIEFAILNVVDVGITVEAEGIKFIANQILESNLSLGYNKSEM
jgi:hypothetical protein